MGLLLWGCKTTADGKKSCTFSKSNAITQAVVRADTRASKLTPARTWCAISPETQPDDAGSDVPADDDDSEAGKALSVQGALFPALVPEKTGGVWRYGPAYRPPVRPSITPPPPQASA